MNTGPGDKQFTRYFIKPVDAFITMSAKVMQDLKSFTTKPAQQVVHPLYDNFGEAINKAEARKHLGLNVVIKSFYFLDLFANTKDWIYCSKQ